LVEGDVWVSKAAHKHIAEDHPDDYPLIWAALPRLLVSPDYVGEQHKKSDSFYLVTRVPVDGGVLMAISLEMTEYGTYNLRSAYSIKQTTIDNRRDAGNLHIISRK
jgi:hypothetical protein